MSHKFMSFELTLLNSKFIYAILKLEQEMSRQANIILYIFRIQIMCLSANSILRNVACQTRFKRV
jgi:hypothetical protein